ncbi:hypothetical protein PGT21_034921 [Puccinia graminis f. sp. tritici]|uniref:Uncharacterized protein n=1 Tax=Puccinia graminis f. sp. tritici TaxID=56615 RepID=A0A5B0PZT1_PUCGR|nr:hypothetical protein PGT21_034921 [Puccinia graminis f. sp. tritici]KAA1126375.1 hypothetical protein PGTUg99_029875 [Puccinia graminis f. sp. tritici]
MGPSTDVDNEETPTPPPQTRFRWSPEASNELQRYVQELRVTYELRLRRPGFISFRRFFLADQATRADYPELQGVPIVVIYRRHLIMERMERHPISPHASH